MKKITHFISFFFLFLILTVMPAYATETETDMYGNVIDWNTSIQTSGEDSAGVEFDYDLMAAPEMTAEEQSEVLAQIPKTTVSESSGYVNFNCDFDESWPGYNVTVILYDENNKRLDYTLYQQNGFARKEKLPVGVYKIYKAYVPGDESGERYPLVFSDSKLVVTENTVPVLTVSVAKELNTSVVTRPAVENIVDDTIEKGVLNEIKMFLVIAIGVTLTVSIISVIYVTHKHKKFE